VRQGFAVEILVEYFKYLPFLIGVTRMLAILAQQPNDNNPPQTTTTTISSKHVFLSNK